uniref:B-box zinc finger protein-like protein n=1 Tax=Cymbidium goeringii TaxID=112607 RepID=A0A385IUB3_9ASPA|nr:B-box zinc finger protein-like protein [Cymbidium goeringii]
MKIQCDVCGVKQASVLCCADEAALCSGCDCRIHSANKLAGKHRRFSLLLPSHRPLPLCDICKKKNGFVFCQEDRKILCRDCDVSIHTANVHAGRHSRFLLTGIRLSSSPIPSPEDEVDSNSKIEEQPLRKTAATKLKDEDSGGSGGSSITDYLMKMLPGWRVDDFLFDDPAADENEAGAGLWKVHGTQPAANVPLFTQASLNASTELVAPPEMQWLPAMSSEELSHARWSEEDASMVPELSNFHYNYRNNKRHKTSLWS